MHKFKKILIFLSIIIAFLFITATMIFSQSKFGRLPEGKRLERIQKSPNYKDGEFKNLLETPMMTGNESSFKTMLKFFFGRNKNITPEDSIPCVKTNLKALPTSENIIVWLGHSSYYIQLDGKRFLVDPVLSGHASPFSWMINAFKGADSYKIEDIPAIDYLIITHDHWDHLDYKTVMHFKPTNTRIICALGVGSHFEYWGFAADKITELDWYEQVSGLDCNWQITATPTRHFSGRGLKRNQTLWASFVVQSPSYKLFIGGDGGYGPHFAEIGKKYGPFDIAILEQGQYDMRWRYIHMLPQEVFEAVKDLNAKRLLPCHNSKFALANHDWKESLTQIVENSSRYNIPALTPKIGEQVKLNDLSQTFSQWWLNVK